MPIMMFGWCTGSLLLSASSLLATPYVSAVWDALNDDKRRHASYYDIGVKAHHAGHWSDGSWVNGRHA